MERVGMVVETTETADTDRYVNRNIKQSEKSKAKRKKKSVDMISERRKGRGAVRKNKACLSSISSEARLRVSVKFRVHGIGIK
jgi:hypothetical protein